VVELGVLLSKLNARNVAEELLGRTGRRAGQELIEEQSATADDEIVNVLIHIRLSRLMK
jgi:hypothetical protein